MNTRQIDLTTRYTRFISREVKAGKYRDESEVVQAGLRLLEQQEKEEQEKLNQLRQMAQDGFAALDRGDSITIHGTTALQQFIRRVGQQAAKRAKTKN